MIGMLRGEVWEIQNDKIVLDVQGVGYLLAVPLGLLGKTRVGEKITLYTHLIVREEELSLVGFASAAEKRIFLEMLNISGIGPKAALAVLSTFGAREAENAIARRDVQLLTKVPGIGKKTAERLVLELKDKFGGTDSADTGRSLKVSGAGEEALEALLALGFGLDEARRALGEAVREGEEAGSEERIRRALKLLARPG
ncbi:Holliday junction ATP-dependent DNA helicase RuvA [ruvA] [Acididesulfobacillus acetoxydans]|uniref:Holliday junction branch migration complex subunit RuvA n=1 Tax=Acididesulfobacillus acetoxydans TaxID=1561005 RepID=A0A8S0W8A6_9FIRM|nr:Holliday junction branch migration protein RuvA [Acididesulfobacillus acetoxydans]CAA7601679.1 Holliday junction ATP-dependent DNA helicase RuvA [ruvA] [Acididesulfobacillus acetoxydans]CEJ09102.1 Holliday junction ATP-dependent DNA helicase RuvA [Acididesulfobacillus acetoxydans]